MHDNVTLSCQYVHWAESAILKTRVSPNVYRSMHAEKSKASRILSEVPCTDACKRWALQQVAAPAAATNGQQMQEPSSQLLPKRRRCCSRKSTRLLPVHQSGSLKEVVQMRTAFQQQGIGWNRLELSARTTEYTCNGGISCPPMVSGPGCVRQQAYGPRVLSKNRNPTFLLDTTK